MSFATITRHPTIDQALTRLVELPDTPSLEREVERATTALLRRCPEHDDRAAHRHSLDTQPYVGALAKARARLEMGHERDALQADRPDGCFCLGLGGRYEVWLPLPGEDDPRRGWRDYCTCPEGREASEAHDALLRQARGLYTKARLDRLWSSIPDEFRDLGLETFATLGHQHAATVGWLRSWLELESDAWLCLWGPSGRGKTGLGIGCARVLAGRGQSSVFVSAPDILDRLVRTYQDREAASETTLLDSLYSVDVLVLDDLGQQRATAWATDRLKQVITHRSGDLKRTIITSNFSPSALSERMDAPALGSRLVGRCGGGQWIKSVADLPSLRLQAA